MWHDQARPGPGSKEVKGRCDWGLCGCRVADSRRKDYYLSSGSRKRVELLTEMKTDFQNQNDGIGRMT